jgi:tetratricopeptide (TPR) repeat protein
MRFRLLMLAASLAFGAQAAPWVPDDDAQVLETIAEKRDPQLAGLTRLRSATRAEPNDVVRALAFARRAIEASRSTGDPRFVGQAQSTLAPWWSLVDAPASVLLIRATIKQSLHDFDGALNDLDRLLERLPHDAQARLTRATVRMVVGRFAEAAADCDALAGRVAPLVLAACRADVASRVGRSAQALDMLLGALEDRGDAGIRAWAATMAAEIAARRGERERAERLFRRSLAIDPADPYTLGAYADWLLDQRRPGEVVTLLETRTRRDALLLRLVIALRELPGREAYEMRRAELAARVEAARSRGDRVHLREEARYMLVIRQDANEAARLARDNFGVQREPADLRVLAQAARAAGDRAALREARDWMRRTGLEDEATATLLAGDRS